MVGVRLAGVGFVAVLLVPGAAALFVAAGHFHVYASEDGTSWAPQTVLDEFSPRDLISLGGLWVIVGPGGVHFTSDLAAGWTTAAATGGYQLSGVATDGTNLVVVGSAGWVGRSADVSSWNFAHVTTTSLEAVATDGSTWLAVGGGGEVLRSSDAGASWVEQPQLGTADLHAVLWNAQAGLWVTGGENVYESPDGTTWTWIGGVADANDLDVVGGRAALAGGSGNIGIWTGAVSSGWHWQQAGTEAFNGLASCAGVTVVVGNGGKILTDAAADSGVPSFGVQPSGTTDDLGAVACSQHPLACYAAASSGAIGAPFVFAASGGTPPYSWAAPGSSNPGPTEGPALSAAFDEPGTHSIILMDSGAGFAQQTAECVVTIQPSPPPTALACTIPIQVVASGTPASLSAAGGQAPYTWMAPGSDQSEAVQDGAFSPSFLDAGAHFVTVQDAAGAVAHCEVDVVVAPVPPLAEPWSVPAACAVAGSGPDPVSVDGACPVPTQGDDAPPAPDAAVPGALSPTMKLEASSPTAMRSGLVGNGELGFGDACPAGRAPCALDASGLAPVPLVATGCDGASRALSSCTHTPSAATPLGSAVPAPRDTAFSPPAFLSGLATGCLLVIVGFRGIRWWFLALFTRLRRNDLLDHPTRAALFARVEAEPGIHFRALMRAVGKGQGTVRHHLEVLVAGGLLEDMDVHGFKGYRLAGPCAAGPPLPASRVLGTRHARRLRELLEGRPPTSVRQLAEAVGLSYGGTMHHLRRLQKAGLVRLAEVPGQGLRASFVPAMPSERAGLLAGERTSS